MAKDIRDIKPEMLRLLSADYRSGVVPIAELAKRYDLSPLNLDRIAQRNGWVRDLMGDIARERNRRMATEMLDASSIPNLNGELITKKNPQQEVDDRAVEAAASAQIDIINLHRSDLKMMREDGMQMMAEMQQIDREIRGENLDPVDKLKVLRMRSGIFKDITSSARQLIPMERQAYGIVDEQGGDNADSYEALLELANG